MTIFSDDFPGCLFCQHVNPAKGSCAAFPYGIPMAIAAADFDHRQPWPGDNGIRFEPKKANA